VYNLWTWRILFTYNYEGETSHAWMCFYNCKNTSMHEIIHKSLVFQIDEANMSNSAIESLNGHKFIALTTFRKNGLGVLTPVWFAVDGEKFYIWTEIGSGKAKRIRNNPQVQVAPSDMAGKVLGPGFMARARMMAPEEWPAADQIYQKKYGLQLTLFRAAGQLRGGKQVFLEITPEA
jgi:PPOX class probable F420-dependent enzyme